jgi:hypothetical protein
MSSFSDAMTMLQRHPSLIDNFAETLRPELIEEALHATGTASIRHRKLPADQIVLLMVGLALYSNRSIRKVFETLSLQLDGRVVSSSLSDARKRLGPLPMEYLFSKLGHAWTKPHENNLFKGMSLFGIDGSVRNFV